jgi:hypothetical protein
MTNRGRETEVTQLVHHLVRQRAGLGHQPDTPALVMSGGMMPALDCPGEISPGTVGTNQSGRAPLRQTRKNSAVSLTGHALR